MVEIKDYINELLNYKNKNFIKVITGLRRVRKSTLIDLYIKDLKKSGVTDSQILKLNFELPKAFDIKTYLELTKIVLKFKKNKEGKLYLFFYEIGRVSEWEKAINAFHSMNEFEIYKRF